MQIAWALVKIHDHNKGLAVFKKSADVKTYDLEAITQSNIDDFMQLAKTVNWEKIDFIRFSRFQNPELSQYQFSLTHVINSLKTKSSNK